MSTLAQCQANYDSQLPDSYWDDDSTDFCDECGVDLYWSYHEKDCSNYCEEGD